MINSFAAILSVMFGVIGAAVYTLAPPAAQKSGEIANRIIAGAIVGLLFHIVSGTSPLDSASDWNAGGVVTLVVAGYAGLASLGTVIPELFNKDSSKVIRAKLPDSVNKIQTVVNEVVQPTNAKAAKEIMAGLEDIKSVASLET